jgi:hypothetical protein
MYKNTDVISGEVKTNKSLFRYSDFLLLLQQVPGTSTYLISPVSSLHKPKSMNISINLAFSISTALVVRSNFVYDIKTDKLM